MTTSLAALTARLCETEACVTQAVLAASLNAGLARLGSRRDVVCVTASLREEGRGRVLAGKLVALLGVAEAVSFVVARCAWWFAAHDDTMSFGRDLCRHGLPP